MTNLDSALKSRVITLPTKIPIVKAMVFPWVMYGCESWTLKRQKNWCLQTVVLEKTPESPFDSREIKPVNLKGDQPWIFTGRTDTEAEAPVLSSSDTNRWLIGKVPDAGKDWGQKEKRALEDEMAGQYHQCNECKLGHVDVKVNSGRWWWTGRLVCCNAWGHKESDKTERLNWTELNGLVVFPNFFNFFHQCLVIFCVQFFCLFR